MVHHILEVYIIHPRSLLHTSSKFSQDLKVRVHHILEVYIPHPRSLLHTSPKFSQDSKVSGPASPEDIEDIEEIEDAEDIGERGNLSIPPRQQYFNPCNEYVVMCRVVLYCVRYTYTAGYFI